jgi:3-oxoacyl-[acyl-carrier-protein] synthase III
MDNNKQEQTVKFSSFSSPQKIEYTKDVFNKNTKYILTNTDDNLFELLLFLSENSPTHKSILKLIIDMTLNKFFLNLEHYGNTSAASIPIALDEYIQEQPLRPGDKLMLVGFGAGLTWGGALINL